MDKGITVRQLKDHPAEYEMTSFSDAQITEIFGDDEHDSFVCALLARAQRAEAEVANLRSYKSVSIVENLRTERDRMFDDLEAVKDMYEEARAEIEQLNARLNAIAEIIRVGDQRLLAADGPCGGQPPDISLGERYRMYLLATEEVSDEQ